MVNDTQLLESIDVTNQAKEVNVGSRAEFSRNLRQRDREKVVRAAQRQEVDWMFKAEME